MIFRELPVPEPARRAAACAWRFSLEDHDPPRVEHLAPPDGATNIVVVRTGEGQVMARLIGPATTARRIPALRGWGYAGLRLRPEAARSVTGRRADPDLSEPLSIDGRFQRIIADLAGLAAGEWSGGGGIAESLAGAGTIDTIVADAVDALAAGGGTVPIAGLAAASGLGDRQFRRRFRTATGLSARQYAAIQRLRHALLLSIEGTDWAGAACGAGFADQPHLARDVKSRFGAAPTVVRGYLGGISHELLTPAGVRFIQDPARRPG